MTTKDVAHEDFLSPRELARRLKVSLATIHRWKNEGVIAPTFSVASSTRFCWQEVLIALKGATASGRFPGRPNPKRPEGS